MHKSKEIQSHLIIYKFLLENLFIGKMYSKLIEHLHKEKIHLYAFKKWNIHCEKLLCL